MNELVNNDDVEDTTVEEYERTTGFDVVCIDNNDAKKYMDEQRINELKEKTKLGDFQLNTRSSALVLRLVDAPCSPVCLRKILRTFVGANINLDRNEDAESAFIEATTSHFLSLLLSQRPPLVHKTLERTAAIDTVILVVSKLFIDVNDIITFKWFEVLAPSTKDTKWDGIGFSVSNKKLAAILIEFSGGLDHNTNGNKEADDIVKLIQGSKTNIEFISKLASLTCSVPQYVVRCYDKSIHFEAVIKLQDDTYVRRCYISVPIATTTRQLQGFLENTSSLFQWRNAVTSFVKKVIK